MLNTYVHFQFQPICMLHAHAYTGLITIIPPVTFHCPAPSGIAS